MTDYARKPPQTTIRRSSRWTAKVTHTCCCSDVQLAIADGGAVAMVKANYVCEAQALCNKSCSWRAHDLLVFWHPLQGGFMSVII